MASSSRSREKQQASEVNSARNKLDGVLQTLMDKAEDSPEASDDDCSKFIPEVIVKEIVTSPSKRIVSNKTPRKRRRKEYIGGKDTSHGHFSYVMKLFDRSVDLAKFKEDTPLYPICRAWMCNEPYSALTASRVKSEPLPVAAPPPPPSSSSSSAATTQPVSGRSEETTQETPDEQDEDKKDVHSLPAPLRRPKTEESRTVSRNVPTPPPSSQTLTLNLDDYDAKTAPPKETLLSGHLVRWKAVRQKWKEAAAANEIRYKESLTIIKSLKTVYE